MRIIAHTVTIALFLASSCLAALADPQCFMREYAAEDEPEVKSIGLILKFEPREGATFDFFEKAVTGKNYRSTGSCAWVKNKDAVLECHKDWTSEDGFLAYPAEDGTRLQPLGQGIPMQDDEGNQWLISSGKLLVMLGFACGTDPSTLRSYRDSGRSFSALRIPDREERGSTPWEAVLADYERVGHADTTFRNRHGNTWHIWRSAISGNTLIWSKKNKSARGEGFNCRPSGRANYWSDCSRYDLESGVQNGRVSLSIVNGTVTDRPRR